MTTEAALLQAIIDTPDDDAVRLVYADYMEEHGHTARAEFVRIQVALACKSLDAPDSAALVVRQQELLAQHQDAWAAPVLRQLRGMVSHFEFRRGFIEDLTLEGHALRTHAEELFRLAPVRRLTVYLARSHIGAIAQTAQLGHLAELDLASNRLGDDGVRVLVESPHLAGLVRLNLAWNAVGDAGADALSAGPMMGQLRVLELYCNNIGHDGALALARSPHLEGLTVLDVVHNPIGSAAHKELRVRFGPRVKLNESPAPRRRTTRRTD